VEGQTVEVFTNERQWVARGSYSSKSQIRVRILSFDLDEHIDENFIGGRISRAIALRKTLPDFEQSNGCRLVFGESDGLPGVIVDRYGDYLVCQFLSTGAEFWKETIIRKLGDIWPCKGIYERSDTDSRLKEGLTASVGISAGEKPPELIEIQEDNQRYLVDIYKGHKTGFYLDQRQNRRKMLNYCEGKEVLNAFSYTGGFGLSAIAGKALKVTNVDTSEDCLKLAEQNFSLNGAGKDQVEFVQADVFNLLRSYRDARRQFDLIILDPPKFVASASQLAGGSRGYKDINLLAFKLLRPGGTLVTFSCSGYVKPDLFQKITADAAVDAGCQAMVLDFLSQGPDHPVLLSFPEALYLKGLICRVN
jgi:23S rRNA (cytosine1962-C5)-methyltransferase